MSPATCRDCHLLIAWVGNKGERVPKNVVMTGNGECVTTSVDHWNTCPVRLRRQAESKCIFCYLSRGLSPLDDRGRKLREEPKPCAQHPWGGIFWVEGRALAVTVDSIRILIAEERNKERMQKRIEAAKEDNVALEEFLR